MHERCDATKKSVYAVVNVNISASMTVTATLDVT